MQQSAQSLTQNVSQKLQFRSEKEETDYMDLYTKNILKRTEAEKRKKKIEEDRLLDQEYMIEEKRNKKAMIKERLEYNNRQKQQR